LRDRSFQLFIDVDLPLRDQKQHVASVGDRSLETHSHMVWGERQEETPKWIVACVAGSRENNVGKFVGKDGFRPW